MAAEQKKRQNLATTAVNDQLPELLHQGEKSGYDKLLHERTRLAIISALAANPMLTFNDLKSKLRISDGNLSVHARKLEEAGYLQCSKRFEGRRPRTEYRITNQGRRVLNAYLGHMEALIKAVKKIEVDN